jgi:hypothetical protein
MRYQCSNEKGYTDGSFPGADAHCPTCSDPSVNSPSSNKKSSSSSRFKTSWRIPCNRSIIRLEFAPVVAVTAEGGMMGVVLGTCSSVSDSLEESDSSESRGVAVGPADWNKSKLLMSMLLDAEAALWLGSEDEQVMRRERIVTRV